ncbi:hypothetical protein GQ457_01G016470 [Hibiscus cannabinus]
METKGSITNMNNHMKVCLQKPKGNTLDLKQSELSFTKVGAGCESETTIFSIWKFDRYAIKKTLIHMIVVDELPFRIVEGQGFKQFLYIACPRSENIGQALEKSIQDLGIERVFTITVDNASANGSDVTYIRESSSRMKRFYDQAKEELMDTEDRLQLDMPTRWHSTYMMLKVAAKYEHAFDLYVRDDDSFFLDLTFGDEIIACHCNCFWKTLIEIHWLLDEWLSCND